MLYNRSNPMKDSWSDDTSCCNCVPHISFGWVTRALLQKQLQKQFLMAPYMTQTSQHLVVSLPGAPPNAVDISCNV